MSTKSEILAEVAALEATLPPPSPTASWPFIAGPEDLCRVSGRSGGFIIGPHYSSPIRVRKMLAELAALED